MNLFIDVLMDAAIDSVRMLPFLFAAFCLLEAMERHAGNFSQRVLTGIRGAGPLLGAVLGCVPQCGFSVLAANLFSGGMISAGTLLAVFLSTSDEAILMIMGQPESAGVVGKLLFVKVVIAVLAGYLIDFCFPKLFSEKKEIHDLCEKESCGCGHSHGVILLAWNHTLKLFIYIFLFSACLNLVLEVAGIERWKAFSGVVGVSANFDGFDRVCSELCCIRPSDGVVYQRRNQLCGGSGRTLYERRSRTGCTVESKSESEGKYKDDGSALWSRCCGRNYFDTGYREVFVN